MKKTEDKISIVFFGAGPVAAASLRLLAKNFRIEAVVTKAKPAGHRGEFPTLTVAHELGLPTYTPANKKELSELFATKPFTSNVGVVIDYGIIIAQDVIDYFAYGIVNSHFSLLPQWRGADPITYSLLSGQSQTGVSLMLITAGLDEGPVFGWGVYNIKSDDTNESLTEQLIYLSDALLRDMLPKYLSGEFKPNPQESVAIAMELPTEPTYSRKLLKTDGLIDWQKSANQIEREIRAYHAWPKSYTKINGLDVVITKAHATEQKGDAGTPAVVNKELVIYCGDGAIVIEKIKPAGKPEMDASGFINGYKKYL
jgi:methionyl-tRNA formyltransferase